MNKVKQTDKYTIYCVCIWSFGRARSLERAAHAHTHARANTHTHARKHTHFSLRNSVSRVDCTSNISLSNMSSNLVTVKTAFYNNRQMIDLILTLSFGQGGTNARRCEEKEVVLEETRYNL